MATKTIRTTEDIKDSLKEVLTFGLCGLCVLGIPFSIAGAAAQLENLGTPEYDPSMWLLIPLILVLTFGVGACIRLSEGMYEVWLALKEYH